jgi:flagellar biosynthetic protein FliR
VDWVGLVLPTFVLILARAIGLVTQAPILSNKNVPAPVRMALAVALSVIVITLLPQRAHMPDMILVFFIMALTEFMLGAIFGYAANFMFYAIQSAGELSGVQAGMSFASTMNPLLKTSVNPIGTLYYNLALVTFLLIGGHLWLIEGFVRSFSLVPLGGFVLTPAVAGQFITMSESFLVITIQLALPAIVVLFLTDVGLGYINKVAPQASNIIELVQAVKPVAGLVLVLLLFPNLMSVTHTLTDAMIHSLDKFLHIAGQR